VSISNRTIIHTILAALLVLSAAICVTPQDKKAVKQNAREKGAAPAEDAHREDAADEGVVKEDAVEASTYAYEFKQPEFIVRHILVEHDARGRGHVSFERKGTSEMIVEPLELSPVALARITALWETLQFLDSKEDYQSDRQFPHLGTHLLRMTRGAHERTAEFNWTHNREAAALANEYRRAADQTIFIFDITVARENQPLNAPKLMDNLDSLLSRGGLSDPQQLVSLLRDLNTDERIPLIARNHAGRLLKKIEK
jgi:hypothetical protein